MKLLQKKQQLPKRRSSTLPREGRATVEELNSRYTFRRNRTLTGSLSSDVSSVNEHHAELRSSRVETHHLRRHRRRLFMIFLGVIIVALGLTWAIYQSIAGVIIVLNAPTPPLYTKPYQQKVQDYLNGHPLERNRVMLDTASLARYLQTHDAPEVLQARVETAPSGLGVSTIVLTMRKPVVSWKTGTTQLYVDASGTAFTHNYYAAPSVEVVDETGIEAVNNQVLASDRFLGFVGRSIGRLEDQGYAATKVVLPSNTTRQLLVSVEGIPYQIKFSVDRPAGEQAEDAARAIHYITSHGIGVAEYLDVRVSGRVYYK